MIVHDPGGLGFRIERLWAFLAIDEDDDEGLVAAPLGPTLMPLVCADEARVESTRQLAEDLARVTGKRIVLARFDHRTDVEFLG